VGKLHEDILQLQVDLLLLRFSLYSVDPEVTHDEAVGPSLGFEAIVFKVCFAV
jgi:hypothetical protein